MRPTWDDYFLGIARAVSARASCDRARIGAVIVSPDRRILSTGYNGAPSGVPSCDEVGHDLVDMGGGRMSCVRTVHAEANAILSAARHGVRTAQATLYTTKSTCYDCAQASVQAGVRRIVFAERYDSARSNGKDIVALLTSYGVEMVHRPAPDA